MSINRKRHLMLKALYEEGNKEIDEMRGCKLVEISNKVGLNDLDCRSIIQEFNEKGYINTVRDDYYITTTGVCAFRDKIYLNKVWYRSWSNWLSIIAIVISIIALFRTEG